MSEIHDRVITVFLDFGNLFLIHWYHQHLYTKHLSFVFKCLSLPLNYDKIITPLLHTDLLYGLTSFDVDILTPDFARGVLGSAVVRVVVDQLAEAGWQEVEDLEGSIGVDVADARDIVNLLAGRQIPAQRGGRRATSRTGHRGPCGAGKYYLLQRCIDKV